MATVAAINAQLDASGTGMGSEIQFSVVGAVAGSKDEHYVLGGSLYPGRARWVQTNTGDTAAAQATTIRNKMLE